MHMEAIHIYTPCTPGTVILLSSITIQQNCSIMDNGASRKEIGNVHAATYIMYVCR